MLSMREAKLAWQLMYLLYDERKNFLLIFLGCTFFRSLWQWRNTFL